MPELKIKIEDPLRILESTETVLKKSQFVSVDEENISKTANHILNRFQKGFSAQELDMGARDILENDLQLIFLEDAVNFCFWPDNWIL